MTQPKTQNPMKINLVEKYNATEGQYTFSREGVACGIFTGARLNLNRGFGAILNVLVKLGPKTKAQINAQIGCKPKSNMTPLGWGRKNGLLTYDPTTHEYAATDKGRAMYDDIVLNSLLH